MHQVNAPDASTGFWVMCWSGRLAGVAVAALALASLALHATMMSPARRGPPTSSE